MDGRLRPWWSGILLLGLPLLVLQPVIGSREPDDLHRTHADAAMLAQVSQAVLADEPYDEARTLPGLMAPARQEEAPPVDQKLIEAQLNAVRAEQAELEALCSYAERTNADDACLLEQLRESCARKRERLKAQYEALRAIRGDRRKQTTKFFAALNRARREIWRGLGPLGRNIVRNLAKDAVSVVTSQGQITGQVFRVLLRKHVRHELQTAAWSRLARRGGAATTSSSACDEKTPVDAAAAAPEAQPQDAEAFRLPGAGVWELTCDEQDPFVIEDIRSDTWELKIDFGSRTFWGSIERSVYDRVLDDTFVWVETVSGDVTEDGYLRGTGNWKSGLREDPIAWTGAIAADLSHVCIARTLRVDLWLTPDWIRQTGREMFMTPGEACTGLCVVAP